MNLRYWVLSCAFAALPALAASGYASHAAGQDVPTDAAPERADDTPNVVFDPAVTQRLQQVEAEHRKAREQGLKDPKAWAEDRGKRASQRRAELGQIWGVLVDGPDAQARLRIQADRMARLNRMLDLAQQKGDAALIKRVQKDIDTAIVKHARDMQTLRAALGGK